MTETEYDRSVLENLMADPRLAAIYRNRHPDYGLDPYFLARFAQAAEPLLKEAMNLSVPDSLIPPPCHCDLSFLLGRDWAEHALRHRPFFWHKPLKEPDVTGLIAEVLNYEYAKTRRRVLAETFVRAVHRACGLEARDICFDRDQQPVEITAEESARTAEGTYKRIDLSLYWRSDQDVRALIIEAKFEAGFENDLQMYEEQCQRTCTEELLPGWGGPAKPPLTVKPPLKVLLVQKPIHGPSGWLNVSWQQLLAAWEDELQARQLPDDPEHKRCRDYGGQLRAAMARKLYGVPNA